MDLETLKQQVKQLQNRARIADDELTRLHNDGVRIKKELKSVLKENRRLQTENGELKNQNERLRELELENQNLRKRNKELEDALKIQADAKAAKPPKIPLHYDVQRNQPPTRKIRLPVTPKRKKKSGVGDPMPVENRSTPKSRPHMIPS